MQHMCCHISVASRTPCDTYIITVPSYTLGHPKTKLLYQGERGRHTVALNQDKAY